MKNKLLILAGLIFISIGLARTSPDRRGEIWIENGVTYHLCINEGDDCGR
jgi:hypothetical protein